MLDHTMIYKFPGDYLIDGEHYEIQEVPDQQAAEFLEQGWSSTPLQAKQAYLKAKEEQRSNHEKKGK